MLFQTRWKVADYNCGVEVVKDLETHSHVVKFHAPGKQHCILPLFSCMLFLCRLSNACDLYSDHYVACYKAKCWLPCAC